MGKVFSAFRFKKYNNQKHILHEKGTMVPIVEVSFEHQYKNYPSEVGDPNFEWMPIHTGKCKYSETIMQICNDTEFKGWRLYFEINKNNQKECNINHYNYFFKRI